MANIFIHAAILDRCTERLIQYIEAIHNSGLIKEVNHIFICFVGEKMPNLKSVYIDSDKVKFIKVSNNLLDYELPTLQFMYDFCQKNKGPVLYVHTKNVGKDINLCIEDQIEYMIHFNITKYKDCLIKLMVHDTCGVDLRMEPTLHYSGNFWWANSDYILSLPSPFEFNNLSKYPNPLHSLRHNQEFWICYNKKNHCSLWDCGINCYERHLHKYPRHLYS
jgi:hypothetical protein